MSVRECQRRVSSREFAEWMAKYLIDPWGEKRADMRAGTICATIANAHRGRKSRPYKPSDFMLDFGEPKKRQTPEQMASMFSMYAKAHNKAVG